MNNSIDIDISHISKRFGNIVALDDVSMQFNAGTLYGVIGPAGAGKTTLFRLMLHLMKQNSGTITYTSGGAPIDFEDARALIAYIPQSQSLYADLSVEEHLDFFRRLYVIPDNEYAA